MLEDGYYRLLGRTSVDIIKHGGYKAGPLGCATRRLLPRTLRWRCCCSVLLLVRSRRWTSLEPPLLAYALQVRTLPVPCLDSQISALSVESALLEHPDIAEAAVLGLPDEALGEVGGLRGGAQGPCASRLRGWWPASHQLPTPRSQCSASRRWWR